MFHHYDNVALEFGLNSFGRLNNAISYIASRNLIRKNEGKEEFKIFSREYDLSRRRWFIVSTTTSFFYRYQHMPTCYRS